MPNLGIKLYHSYVCIGKKTTHSIYKVWYDPVPSIRWGTWNVFPGKEGSAGLPYLHSVSFFQFRENPEASAYFPLAS